MSTDLSTKISWSFGKPKEYKTDTVQILQRTMMSAVETNKENKMLQRSKTYKNETK